MYGGIFLYPNNANTPQGKLRLLYECNPASFIVEQAGGKGTNGYQDILDLQPETIHDRTQVFLGSPEEIEELHKYIAAGDRSTWGTTQLCFKILLKPNIWFWNFYVLKLVET